MSKYLTHGGRMGILIAILALFAAGAEAGHARIRGAHANAGGGVSGGTVAVGRGANGAYARGHHYSSDGAGNAAFTSGGTYHGVNGASATRAGSTTRGADGSLSHQSGFSASGTNGSISSQGVSTRDADGINANRTTHATGANGNSYNGTTSYSKDTGVTHTGTCTDAGGNVISCR